MAGSAVDGQNRERGLFPWSLLGTCIAGLGILLFTVGVVDNLNFTVDDSFIPLRYAENLAGGRGLVFNAGERVEGVSNLMWTALLAGIARTGPPGNLQSLRLLIAAKLIGALLGLAAMLLLWWVTARAARHFDVPGEGAMASLAVLGAGATYSISLWSVSGLETPLATLLVTLSGVLFFLGLRAPALQARSLLMGAGLVTGVLTLVRPEIVFVWGFAIGAMILLEPSHRRPLIAAALITLAVYGSVEIWRWTYYHALLPNSVIAKSGGGITPAILGTKYALAGIAGSVGILGIGLLGIPSLWNRGAHWRFLILLCTSYILSIIAGGGDWMPGFRLHVPILPLVWFLCTAALIAFLAERPVPLPRGAVLLVVGGLCVASFFSGRAYVRAQETYPTGLKQVTWISSPMRVEVARDLRSTLAPGDTLALFEAGCIPFFLPDVHIEDLSGLNDPELARLPGLHMHKLTAAYFLKQNPRYYMTMLKWGRPSGDGLVLLGTPEFRTRYRLIRYFEARKAGVQAVMAGSRPAEEEDVSFALFERTS